VEAITLLEGPEVPEAAAVEAIKELEELGALVLEEGDPRQLLRGPEVMVEEMQAASMAAAAGLLEELFLFLKEGVYPSETASHFLPILSQVELLEEVLQGPDRPWVQIFL
jgi:hypothetical protein